MAGPIAPMTEEGKALLTGGEPRPVTVSISIVTYGGDTTQLRGTVHWLSLAAGSLCSGGSKAGQFILVDNGPYGANRGEMLAGLLGDWPGGAEVLSGHGNVGYGHGHNLAIVRCHADYHLVLNPDVELAPDALAEALAFMDQYPECGLLAPAVRDDDGALQYLCKRLPTVLDLLLRGFAPVWLRRRFGARLDRYEMRDLINERDLVWDPPIVSGCFMLFRTEVLKRLGGFDPKFFLYFEDFDLALRAGEVARIAYVPSVRIIHHGGGAARKGMRHVRMFVVSAVRFFNKQGWRWL
jgi:hypothetical protein